MAFQPTKDYIETLLATQISTFELGAGCNENDNVAGSLKSLTAVSKKTGAKIQTVLKTFPPKDSPHYEYIKEGGIFRIEADVYSKLFPSLEAFVESRGGGPYSPPIPKLIGNFHDDENDFICLEDVRPEGYSMPSVFKGLKYEEASVILKELGKFHATSYALIRHQGEQLFEEKFYRLNARNEEKFREEKLQVWHFILQTAVRVAVDVLKRINPKLAVELKEEIPPETVGKLYGSLTDATDQLHFPCVLHGDLWSNNCLLKYNSAGKPIGVKFVDFQHTRRGNIFEDLVYFILTSTTTELRSEYLTRMLQDYFASFQSSLESINVNLPIGFSLGFLIDNFNRYLKWGLAYMCFAIPLQLGNPADVYKEQANRKKEGNGLGSEGSSPAEASEVNEMEENLQLMFESSLHARVRLEEVTKEVLNRR